MTESLQDFSKIFNVDFQEKLAYIILRDRKFTDRLIQVLDPRLLERKHLQIFVDAIFDYKKKYNRHPSEELLEHYISSSNYEMNPALKSNLEAFLEKVRKNQFNIKDSEQFIKDRALDFCRIQKLKEAMLTIDGKISRNECDFADIQKTFDAAIRKGADNNPGSHYVEDFLYRYEEEHRDAISTGWRVMDDIIGGGHAKGEVGIVIAPTGCHKKGTKILMFDGSIKNVENISIGDILMGPDSKGRLVESLHRGQQTMYKISPIKGESFIVNEDHILSLKKTNDRSNNPNIVNLTVKDYIKQNNTFKHIYKLYRTGIEFSSNPSEVEEPYFMGLMLGDGHFGDNTEAITYAFVKKPEDNKNLIREFFRNNSLLFKTCADKFIPQKYKTASKQNRLEILAGLIDSDGYLHHNGYDFISKSKQLSEDVAFISRSLGLAAYISECEKSCQNNFKDKYYRVSISGDCSVIPCRLERKKASKRLQKKDVLVTGFEVKKLDIDDYYGFTISGDHLYVMGDFTVTHNCGKSMILVHLGAAALKAGKNVVYYTLELSEKVIERRFDSCITQICLDDLPYNKDLIRERIKGLKGRLITKKYPRKRATIIDLKSHLDRLYSDGFEPDVVICDYADLLVSTIKGEKRYQDSEAIYDDFIAFIEEYNICGWTASQTNRTGLEKAVITMDSIADAYNKCHGATLIFSASRTIADKNTNKAKFFIAKNRNGPDGKIYDVKFNTACVDIEVLSEYDSEAVENRDSVKDVLKKHFNKK